LPRLEGKIRRKNFLAFPFLSCCANVLAAVVKLVARSNRWAEGCGEGELFVLSGFLKRMDFCKRGSKHLTLSSEQINWLDYNLKIFFQY